MKKPGTHPCPVCGGPTEDDTSYDDEPAVEFSTTCLKKIKIDCVYHRSYWAGFYEEFIGNVSIRWAHQETELQRIQREELRRLAVRNAKTDLGIT